MDLGFLSFLAEPWFVLPWYAGGLLGAGWVAWDLAKVNTPLKPAMKWAWPIIVAFFSVLGVALYLATARAPGIGEKRGDEKEEAHHAYERSTLRRVNGAVIHCVAGDGLGIMSGMVVARAMGMSFWQEFWLEYLVGFLFGWLIFQYESMTMMTDSKPVALAMAFRAEFFSMLTVMGGMGAVMGFVTPLAATAQPGPLTWAFWGFGMFGLLVGFVLTYPMNWMMVKVGWKHGMGGMEDSPQVEAAPARAGLVTAMIVLGAAALVLPAWLVEVRDDLPVAAPSAAARAGGAPLAVLAAGLEERLRAAREGLAAGRRSEAAPELDAALRAAEVGDAAAPGSAFAEALERVKGARRRLHQGDERGARARLDAALGALRDAGAPTAPPVEPPAVGYAGATLIDETGAKIGEVVSSSREQATLALGGARDVWGFLDLGGRTVAVPTDALVLGPTPSAGPSLVALPGGRPDAAAQGRRPPPRRDR